MNCFVVLPDLMPEKPGGEIDEDKPQDPEWCKGAREDPRYDRDRPHPEEGKGVRACLVDLPEDCETHAHADCRTKQEQLPAETPESNTLTADECAQSHNLEEAELLPAVERIPVEGEEVDDARHHQSAAYQKTKTSRPLGPFPRLIDLTYAAPKHL